MDTDLQTFCRHKMRVLVRDTHMKARVLHRKKKDSGLPLSWKAFKQDVQWTKLRDELLNLNFMACNHVNPRRFIQSSQDHLRKCVDKMHFSRRHKKYFLNREHQVMRAELRERDREEKTDSIQPLYKSVKEMYGNFIKVTWTDTDGNKEDFGFIFAVKAQR